MGMGKEGGPEQEVCPPCNKVLINIIIIVIVTIDIISIRASRLSTMQKASLQEGGVSTRDALSARLAGETSVRSPHCHLSEVRWALSMATSPSNL